MRLVVDDEIEIERRELLAIAAVDHERLDRRHDDGRAEQLARSRRARLVDDGLELRQNDVEILHRLLRQFDAVNDEQHALGVAGQEKAADERGAQQRLAGAGRHFQKKLATALLRRTPCDLIHARSDTGAGSGRA